MQDKNSLVQALEALLSVLHSMPEGSDGGDDKGMPVDEADPDADSDSDMPVAPKSALPMDAEKPSYPEDEKAEDDDLETLRKRPDYMGRMSK